MSDMKSPGDSVEVNRETVHNTLAPVFINNPPANPVANPPKSNTSTIVATILSVMLVVFVGIVLLLLSTRKYVPAAELQSLETTSALQVKTIVAATVAARATPTASEIATPDVAETAASDETRIAVAVRSTLTLQGPEPARPAATPNLAATEAVVKQQIDHAVQSTVAAVTTANQLQIAKAVEATLAVVTRSGSGEAIVTESLTATVSPFPAIVLDEDPHHIGDQDWARWLVRDPVSAHEIEFSLDELPPTSGLFLLIDTFAVDGANPVTVNGNYVGSVPGAEVEQWIQGLRLFLPAAYLDLGPNTITIQTQPLVHGDISSIPSDDDYMIRNVRLDAVPTQSTQSIPLSIVIDDGVSHIGKRDVDHWEMSRPNGTVYSKDFKIEGQSANGGILSLQAYDVRQAISVRVNGTVVGNLPGLLIEETWTPEVRFWVPKDVLRAGTNTIQAGPMDDDDFMISNVKLDVSLE